MSQSTFDVMKQWKFIVLLTGCWLLTVTLSAQDVWDASKWNRRTDPCIVIGLNGWNNLAFRAGYNLHFVWQKGENEEQQGRALTLGIYADWQFLPRKALIPSITARYTWGKPYGHTYFPHFGVDYLLYTDFHNYNTAIRPAVGVQSSFGGSLTYGYCFQTDRKEFIMPTRHNVQVTIPIALLLIPLLLIVE